MIGLIALLTLQTGTYFPFVIPWDDSVRGTATDVTFLNPGPANQWITPRDGHFERGKDRMRFLGTNFTARAAFPSHEDADKVAARLAKLGINIVRFHHMQNSWDAKGTIWKQDKMMIELDPNSLDRLDYLISALKKNGIYANINLQTTRDYLPEMGFPDSVKQLPWSFAKRVDKFDPKMIALQKQYAKDLLDRTNPYTGLKYKDDPAIAVIEINNENSLVGDPWVTMGSDLERVPEPFKGELVSLWNAWLIKKYSSDEALAKAWTQTATPKGPNLIPASPQWAFESQGGTQMQGTPEGRGYVANIAKAGSTNWHIQANVMGLTLTNGETYTVKFRAKASKDRSVLLHAGVDRADFRNVGLTANPALTTQFKDYAYTFKVAGAEPGHTRVGFFLGDADGVVTVQDFSVSSGTDPYVLPIDRSLARKNIDLPTSAPEAEKTDFLDFLTDTESAYSLDMRNYLRKDLGFHNNMVDSQISWGGLTSLVREAPMEFADNHAYYHHPSFTGASWSETDWVVENNPMVGHFLNGEWSELGALARWRIDDKPYTISEYNHPAPMDYQAEMMPLISTFGAIQDWDIVYLFDYGTYGKGEPNDRIQGFFGVGSNPNKMAFLPAAALIFRQGLLPRADAEWLLKLPAKAYATTTSVGDAWTQGGGIPNPLDTRMAITASNVKSPMIDRKGTAKKLAEVRSVGGKNIYVVDTEKVQATVGYVGGGTVATGAGNFTFGSFGNGFATMTLTPCDNRPIKSSDRLLLTLAGRIENRNMGWNADRTSVSNKWGNGPTQAEFVPLKVALKIDSPKTVWILDGNGRRKAKLPSSFVDGHLAFETNVDRPSVWIEIAKP